MKSNQPVTVVLSQSKDDQICPVRALYQFYQSSPLFTFKSCAPVSHSFVTSNFKSALTFCGSNPTLYKGHIFRIGAATKAAR